MKYVWHPHGRSSELHLIFVHATGFCKEVWSPIIEHLLSNNRGRFSISAHDLRGHGESRLPSHMENIVQDWWLSAIDILFLVQELRLREGAKRIVGIGHSIGGAVLLMAALLSPQIFEELITMEPIIRPPPYTLEDNPLSLQAKKRRFQFDTKEEAYHYYKQKKDLFGMWNDRVLRAYIDGGIRWNPQSQKWELKCTPQTESLSFRSGGNTALWSLLPKFKGKLHIWRGEFSWYTPTVLREIVQLFDPQHLPVTYTFTGSDHLFPMQQPDIVANKILETLSSNFYSKF